MHEIVPDVDARRTRIDKTIVAEASMDYAVAVHRWLKTHLAGVGPGETALANALEIISWDSHLIHVKIMRAVDGRDEYPDGDSFDKGPLRSDWNGSAKVALLSIERSEACWRIVAEATGDEAAAVLAQTLTRLKDTLLEECPYANRFHRPGFDD